MKIKPTTTDVSDLINEIAFFVHDNPMWSDDADAIARLAMAYFVLTQISSPDMTLDEEYAFITSIHSTLKEIR